MSPILRRDGEFLIYGAASGPKTRNLEATPRVSLHLEGNGRGGANVIFEGSAAIEEGGPVRRLGARLHRLVPAR